ncbi:hypothetical protein [uncultured Helicobacter sp.]|uniref:hypothetical protein n=1 Tax=uncultured Helicobacter sp. TaxID=175537 RepID=UPI002608F952|nr:hypothetical protein [uncultured Helicobacter sp.]
MRGLILHIESFLQIRSKREIILLFMLCFLIGFGLMVGLFYEGAKAKIAEENIQNVELNRMLLVLQKEISSQKNLNIQDTDATHKEIEEMEYKIALQEERKRLALEKFGVYFLRELSDVNALYNVEIAQEKGQITLEAKGKYNAMLDFLESLQAQPKLSFFAMQLYPNPNTRDLTLYAILQIQGD